MAESETEAVVVSQNPKRNLKKLFLLMAFFALATVVVASADYFVKRPAPATKKEGSVATRQLDIDNNKAIGIYNNNPTTAGYHQAQNYLQKYVTQSSTKQAALFSLTLLALNASQLQDAYNYAMQDEKINPTSDTAYLLALAYEGLSKKVEALTYYKLALSRLSPKEQLSETDNAPTYKAKIAELSQ